MAPARRLWLAGLTCALVLMTGSAWIVVRNRPLSCTMMGPVRVLDVQIDPTLRPKLTSIRVHLKQGDRDDSVEFVPKPTNKYRTYVEQGIFFDKGAFHVGLGSPGMRGALNAEWGADERARVVVEGLRYSGKKVFRHAESFEFEAFYPNGKACDKDEPGLRHTTKVTANDLL